MQPFWISHGIQGVQQTKRQAPHTLRGSPKLPFGHQLNEEFEDAQSADERDALRKRVQGL